MFRKDRKFWLLGLCLTIAGGIMMMNGTAKSSDQVLVGEHGELRVGDEPFLPIFVWSQPVRNFDSLISLGINTFMGEGAGSETAEEFLKAVKERKVWGIIHSNEKNWPLKDHPALLCWMFGDEPDMPLRDSEGKRTNVPRTLPEKIAEQYKAFKAVDTNHPAYLNLTSSFYEQFARYDDETYRSYCQATDIVGYDLYPVTGWGKPEWVPLIGKATHKLRTLAGERVPVWVILECTKKLRWVSQEKLNSIGNPEGARNFELRAMVWLAIVNGAKGIGYFPHRWDPYRASDISEELQAEMKRTNRQLSQLAKVILMPDADNKVKCESPQSGQVNILTKQYEDKLYIFAVNSDRKPASASFFLTPEFRAGKVEAYEERRQIAVAEGVFEDSFEELGVHIYVVSR